MNREALNAKLETTKAILVVAVLFVTLITSLFNCRGSAHMIYLQQIAQELKEVSDKQVCEIPKAEEPQPEDTEDKTE